MTTQTLTLTDFLLARIAEDEQEVLRHTSAGHPSTSIRWPDQMTADMRISPKRVLAECEAKRRIVEIARAASWPDPYVARADARIVTSLAHINDLARVLQAMALPYADHPDYREEWRA